MSWQDTPTNGDFGHGAVAEREDHFADSGIADLNIGTNNGPPRDAAARAAAEQRGWGEPEGFNDPVPSTNGAEQPRQPNFAAGETADWMHTTARYEWTGETGNIGPRNPQLEAELFNMTGRVSRGIAYDNLTSIRVTTEGIERPAPIASFADAGLHPVVQENCRLSGYEVPTPIQAYTIPAVNADRDVVGIAQTGSGKTTAYLVSPISKLAGKADQLCGPKANHLAPDYDHRSMKVRAEPLILVVAPTRELCIQIFDECRRLCYRTRLRPAMAYGGGPTRAQREDLEKGCDILISTPGRLLDFMRNPELLSMKRLRYTILDEADEMLGGDWEQEIDTIFNGGDVNADDCHRYLLFSATFSGPVRRIARRYLGSDHVRIRIGRIGSTVRNIKQSIIWVDGDKKKQALYDLLLASPPARTLVFCATKKTVEIVDDHLFNLGLPSTSLHSDRLQSEREDAMRAFRNGKAPIMIATSVAARGIDVGNILHVINYDLPKVDFGGSDEYIHRIGRTGRLGNEGLATSFYNERDEPLAEFLAKILIENGWEVPDFLEEYRPAGEVDFEDDSEEEAEEDTGAAATNGGGAEDSWGGSAAAVIAPAAESWDSVAQASGEDAGW